MLYIEKTYNKKIPYNKIHKHLLGKGFSKEDKKKKKQRKYCRCDRDHSYSLVHLDWHESKAIEDKQVCVDIDDASRKIICGKEFGSTIVDHNIVLIFKL